MVWTRAANLFNIGDNFFLTFNNNFYNKFYEYAMQFQITVSGIWNKQK